MNRTKLSKRLILEALLRGDTDITALNGMKYLTTRITNHIVKLRKLGLGIETRTVKTEEARYGLYFIESTDDNIKKAYEILETLQDDEAA